jgi:hypothetical protein
LPQQWNQLIINQVERRGGGRSDGNQSLSGVVMDFRFRSQWREGAARKWQQTQVKLATLSLPLQKEKKKKSVATANRLLLLYAASPSHSHHRIGTTKKFYIFSTTEEKKISTSFQQQKRRER